MNLLPGPVRHAKRTIIEFIRDRVQMAGVEEVVIGLSGGLDSALVLNLSVSALGIDNVHPIFLPDGEAGGEDRGYAVEAAKSSGAKLKEYDIGRVVESIPLELEGMARGNACARARMMILFAEANIEGQIVLGTSNKSELLIGYFTKFGDGASDVAPIGDLFKTQVRIMAGEAGIPEAIIRRPPSAGLIPGQTDEGEIRIPYSLLDQVLKGYLGDLTPAGIVEHLRYDILTEEELERSGFQPPMSVEEVNAVFGMVRTSMHKRTPLAVPKIQSNTLGIDLKERW